MYKIKRILLIEDDLDDQLFFKLAVSAVSKDIVCDVASNGLGALKMIGESDPLPELIFLDLNMPIMHGFECLKALKADPKFSAIPVIILSTSNNSIDIEMSKEAGAAGYLNKPNDLTALQQKLDELVHADFNGSVFYM